MKNITVSVDDEVYKRVRLLAAQMDTSVSALVKRYLTGLSAEEPENERLKRLERELREQISSFTASDRVSRDELHARHP